MKKIDLHIHTVKSISDWDFTFCLDSLKEYINKLQLDCIAITNHNLFDLEQFKLIDDELEIKVFPGIEINLEGGHLLLISENTELVDFNAKCKRIFDLIINKTDSITVEQLNQIFPDLARYLLIPHYEKKPNILEETLLKLTPHIFAGEVTSTRKFKDCVKDVSKLTPVIFSDVRIKSDLKQFPTRQTFVDLAEITLRGIKSCLIDKQKVSLSKSNGNKYFQVTDDGLYLSTGLNVMLGERSSGKTFTLNRIQESFENVKYIKQFSLLQDDESKFKSLLSNRHSTVNEQFFIEFKEVVDEVSKLDLKANKIEIDQYLSSLLQFAKESDKLDSYSKAKLFSETLFSETDLKSLQDLIEATVLLIENMDYQDLITKYLEIESLQKLVVDLMKNYNKLCEINLKKRWLNDLIIKNKDDLKFKTATIPPNDIDFYNLLIENEKVKRFIDIAKEIQKEREISTKEIRGFKVVAKTKKFQGAQQMKNKSGKSLAFTTPFSKYSNPYAFLNSLKEIELDPTSYYKYFVDIEFQTLNKYGYPVSGGERSEFNLLHEIRDALQYDILLIDEPESSFDNLFLKNDVNELLKDISREIPVVVVTHNSTVGASIKPDYLIYTRKVINDQDIFYQVFSGYPSDIKLKCSNGDLISNYDILLNCLEAGTEAYDNRRLKAYELLKS